MIKRDLPLHYTALIMFLSDQKIKTKQLFLQKKRSRKKTFSIFCAHLALILGFEKPLMDESYRTLYMCQMDT